VTDRPALAEWGRRLQAARKQAARKHAALSQEAVADASGLHRTAVQLLEAGRREPSLDTLVALSRGLGVTPAEAMEWYPLTGEEAAQARAESRGERRGR
jgi:transcriptional regulator with XRE-family HTH domain